MNPILVTGICGFLGGATFRRFLSNGYPVVGCDRNVYKTELDSEKKNAFKVDLFDKDRFAQICPQNSLIFHFAGSSSVEDSVRNPEAVFKSNISSLFTVLEVARKTYSTVVLPSTGSIYSRENQMPLCETSLLGPPSPYSASKMAAEALCISYRETFGVDVRIARLFSVYGPQMKRFFIFDAIEKMSTADESVKFRGSGEQIRDYMYIDDCIDALELISKPLYRNITINIGSGRSYKISQVADEIKMLLKKDCLKVIFDKNEQNYQNDVFYPDVIKLSKLGFYCKTNLEKGLKECVKILSKNEKY